MTRPTHLLIFASLLIPATATAQAAKPETRHPAPDPWAALLLSTKHTPTPTTTAITAADLRTRLFIFADDSMQGREAGTPGNAKGVEYIASEAKRFGLQPAGQDGTYFQTIHLPVDVQTLDTSMPLATDAGPLIPWQDYLPRTGQFPANFRSLEGVPVIFGGTWSDSNSVITDAAAAGKFVIITSTARGPGNPPGIPSRPEVIARFKSAAGIGVVGLENFPAEQVAAYREPATTPITDSPVPTVPSYSYLTRPTATALLGTPVENAVKGASGKVVHGGVRFTVSRSELQFASPARNVVALLPGSDPVLRNEFVVIGAHNDHIGTIASQMTDIRAPMAHDSAYVLTHLFRKGGADDNLPELNTAQQAEVNGILARVRKLSGGKSARRDSIFNGADDDGSGSVSVLEIAEYLAAQPVKPKRSILFVWHVGEEKGLWGSHYFADHPTVPRESIVAELNMDMVGRGAATDQTGRSIDGKALHGGPGYLQVVGSRRLSTELGDLAETVNTSGKHGIKFDYSMDANGHPQNIYCRSDHAEYARYGIPIAFFTTGGHADYHQLTDEPQYIDYNKMAQVDNFVADLAKHVANLGHRVAVDKPKPDPNGACVQ